MQAVWMILMACIGICILGVLIRWLLSPSSSKEPITTVFCWVFGVITCAYYTFVTLYVCSQTPYLLAFFSPLVIVPVANLINLIWLRKQNVPAHSLAVLLTLSRLALMVSAILMLALIPLCLLAGLATIVFMLLAFPIGLLMLFYLCVAMGPFLSSLTIWNRLHRFLPAERKTVGLPETSCLAILLAVVLLGVFPATMTQACEAAVGSRSTPQALLLLRAMGDENVMQQDCYSEQARLPWFFSMAQGIMSASARPPIDESIAREIYYRTTGRPFNSVPRTKLMAGGNLDAPMPFTEFSGGDSEDNYWDDYYYWGYGDHDFAGETVGGVSRGISLTHSEMTGWVDPDEAIGHLQWAMDFKLKSSAREVRAQILLPPHAVATGCKLVINGVEYPCVIATRESSRQAYQSAAVSNEQPMLISTAGAGRILLQSSTGFWGQSAHLIMDFTTPLQLTDPGTAILRLPMFTERNFAVACPHIIHMNGGRGFYGMFPCAYEEKLHQENGKIDNQSLSDGRGLIGYQRNARNLQVAATDSTNKNNAVLQTITTKTLSNETPAIIVVDGSAPISREQQAICDALSKVRLNHASIIWASDEPIEVVSNVAGGSAAWNAAVSKLSDSSSLGGQNNAEALTLAVDQLAKDSSVGGNVIWIHAGQPVKFSGDNLLPKVRAAKHKIKVYEYQIVAGPNEVIKSLDQSGDLVQIARTNYASSDLDSLFRELEGLQPVYELKRTAITDVPTGVPIAKHSAEIRQLYVNDDVMRHVDDVAQRTKFGTLAEDNYLITPLTSGIILPQGTYADHGVKTHKSGTVANAPEKAPAPAPSHANLLEAIPVKPEPPMSLIMLCALLMMAVGVWALRRRRSHA